MTPRFLVLCRRPGLQTHHLQASLGPLGEVELVCDSPAAGEGIVWIGDIRMEGFGHLAAWNHHIPSLTAWERAWFHIAENRPDFKDGVWLVEDDVAGSPAGFHALVATTAAAGADLGTTGLRRREDDPFWHHWHLAPPHFPHPCCSFNPLCFLSGRLIDAVLGFRGKHGRFLFHEILFASLAMHHAFAIMDWTSSALTSALFGDYRYRPEVDGAVTGISHPAKEPSIHGLLCRQLPLLQAGH